MRKPIFVVILTISFFYACTKIQTTDIGNGLIPPIDGVTVKDTFFDIFTNTFLDENIARVYKSDDHIIGYMGNDPLFGKTTASVFFELKPTSYPFFIAGNKDSLVVDSACLILSYKGIYGDSTIPQTWNVYEISKGNKLQFDSSYDAEKATIGFINTPLGSKTNFDLRTLNDSINDRFENAQNQIRIKLDKSFATRLLKTYDSTNAYKNDSIFRDNFAGFAVVPSTGSGNALVRINLLDTNTKLSLYYTTRLEASTARDTVVTSFRFNTSGTNETSGNANIIKRERAGSQVAGFLNSGKNDSLVFVQTTPGTYVTLKIPNLSKFRNTLIYRAEIELTQAPDNLALDAVLTAPRYLLLTAYDSVNKRKINVPNDYTISQDGSNILSFGGFAYKKDVTGVPGSVTGYNFTLTRYVQGIVTRKDTSYALRLYAPVNDSLYYVGPYPFLTVPGPAYISPANANNIADGRIRLFGGTGQPQTRIRLRVIYSDL